jgi:hypothetical protein
MAQMSRAVSGATTGARRAITPMARTLMVAMVAAVLVGVFVLALSYLKRPDEPSVNGYLDGQEIKFIHTEVSDPKIARIHAQASWVVPSRANLPALFQPLFNSSGAVPGFQSLAGDEGPQYH